MRNKKLLMPAAMMSIIMLAGSIYLSGCSKEAEAAMKDKEEASTEIVESSLAESPREIVEESTADEDNGESEIATTAETEAVISYTVAAMDKEMQVTEQTYVYYGPFNEADMAGEAVKDEIVQVTGKVDDSDWYQIKPAALTENVYIEGKYLKEVEAAQEPQQETQKPQEQQQPQEQQKPQEQQQPQQQTQQPSTEGGVIQYTVDGTPYILMPDGSHVYDGYRVYPDGTTVYDDGTVHKYTTLD